MTAITKPQRKAVPWAIRLKKFSQYLPLYAMMAPFLFLFLVFTVWPIVSSLVLSLTDYTGVAVKQVNFVGLANYQKLIKDTRLHTAMWNITRYVFLSVSLNTVIGLMLAIIYQGQGRINQMSRTMFFMPAVTSGIATLTIWQYVFRSDKYGLLNSVLRLFNVGPLEFLSHPRYFMGIFVFLSIWGGCGMTMIFFLAGLKSINHEYYEAAAIDGANPLQRFFSITLPLLRPTILYVVTTGMIGSFQLFDMAYILGGGGLGMMGGPLDAALTPVLYLYYIGFTRQRIGQSSALAWMLFAIIIVVTLISLRAGKFNEDV